MKLLILLVNLIQGKVLLITQIIFENNPNSKNHNILLINEQIQNRFLILFKLNLIQHCLDSIINTIYIQ